MRMGKEMIFWREKERGREEIREGRKEKLPVQSLHGISDFFVFGRVRSLGGFEVLGLQGRE